MQSTVTAAAPLITRIAVALVALCTAPALAAAPRANADDASYLAKLNESGVPIPLPDEARLTSGHYACAELRMRATPQETIRQLTNVYFYSVQAAEVEVAAAQSELCPETRR